MNVQIVKWGNGQGIRIPRTVMDELELTRNRLWLQLFGCFQKVTGDI